MKLSRAWIRLIAMLVPRSFRRRWREEWLGELDAISRMSGTAASARAAAGASADAWAARSLPNGNVPRTAPFHGFTQDLRHAVRGLAAAPGFTAGVVLSLAIGIGATSGAFGFLHTVMFQQFSGVAHPETLARIRVNRGCGWNGCWIRSSTPADYDVLRTSLPAFESVSAQIYTALPVRIGDDAYSLRGMIVSANYFDVHGVTPAFGRGFTDEEQQPAGASVAVIGHALWQRLFGADPNVLGRFIEVGGKAVRIIGVAPPRFGVSPGGNMQVGAEYGNALWLPLPLLADLAPPARGPGDTPLPQVEYDLQYVGRLRTGATLVSAQADAQVAGARLQVLRGPTGADTFVQVEGMSWALNDPTSASIMLASAMLVPMIVLVIACLNAANLLLARGTQRARDVAVRLALGASAWRVIRLCMAESLVLAAMSGLLSMPVVMWLLAIAEASTGVPMLLNRQAILFTSAASVLCAFAFGLGPALREARKPQSLGSSRSVDPGPGRMRVRRAMVAVQVALSLGLLATGGQMLGAFNTLLQRTGATHPDRLLLVSFDLQQLNFTRAEGEEFYRQMLHRVSLVPGVESVALARRSALWTWGRGSGASPIIVWGPGDAPKDAELYLGGYAGGDLLGTVGLPIVAGRNLRPEDATPRPSAAIVSRAVAEQEFGGAAVGRTIRVAARNHGYGLAVEVPIVGVFDAAEDLAYTKRPMETVYVATPLEYEPALTLYVRSSVELTRVAGAIRATVRELDPRVPIVELETLANLTRRRHFEERVSATALGVLGAIALALATAGLYALVSFLVALRQRELGIRLALGAEPASILRLVLGQSMRLASAGALFGGFAAMAAGAVLHANIFGTPRVNVSLFVGTAVILAAAMALASVVPARRAARVDPLRVLRTE